ncbi:MAG: hypothetical protein J2P30_11715, partial [Actinobacteria bacterium]|nr:hypothetical protein [Actinomycetota bacterium]
MPDGDDYGTVETHKPDELVVALPDRKLVRDALERLGVGITQEDPDERLGLELLKLADVDAAAAQQDSALKESLIKAKWPEGQPKDIELSNIDVILGRLR